MMRAKNLKFSIFYFVIAAGLLGATSTSLADINDSELGKYPDSCQAIYYVNELIGFPDLTAMAALVATSAPAFAAALKEKSIIGILKFLNPVNLTRLIKDTAQLIIEKRAAIKELEAARQSAKTAVAVLNTGRELSALTVELKSAERLAILLPRLSTASALGAASVAATLATTTVFQTACAHRTYIINNSGKKMYCKLQVKSALDSKTELADGGQDIIRSPNKVEFIGCDSNPDNLNDEKKWDWAHARWNYTKKWQERPAVKLNVDCTGEFQVVLKNSSVVGCNKSSGSSDGGNCRKPKSLFGGD